MKVDLQLHDSQTDRRSGRQTDRQWEDPVIIVVGTVVGGATILHARS